MNSISIDKVAHGYILAYNLEGAQVVHNFSSFDDLMVYLVTSGFTHEAP